MADPIVVCVLGMHRSGTSLVTRALHALGAHLGPDEHMMEPNENNPAGFYEHQLITDLNDELLERLGGSWPKPPALSEGWETAPELSDLRRRARAILEEDFAGADIWAWKDPRTCLTLPFWQQVFPPMRYVLCFRNPVDVARSLVRAAERNGVEVENPAALWLTYVTRALQQTFDRPRLLVFYEDVLADWRVQAGRLAAFVGAPKALDDARVARALEQAVEDELWHHRTSLEGAVDDSELDFPVKAAYVALRLHAARAGARRGGRDERGGRLLEIFTRSAATAVKAAASLEQALDEQRKLVAEGEGAVRAVTADLSARDAAVADLRAGLEQEKSALERELTEARERESLVERRLGDVELERDAALERMTTAERELVRARERQASLEDRNATLVQERDFVLRALAELPAALERQTIRGDDLAARIERLVERDGELRAELEEAKEELIRRGQQFAATVSELSKDAPIVRQEVELGSAAATPHPKISVPYPDVVERIRDFARSRIPREATVLVVSRGDYELLKLDGRNGWHFPQTETGTYAGHHPADSAAAIAHLEALRERGAEYLLFPSTAFWWLDHYAELKRHLEAHYRLMAEDDAYMAFELAAPTDRREPVGDSRYREMVDQVRELATLLLPADATVLVASQGDDDLLALDGRRTWHFPRGDTGRDTRTNPADSTEAILQLEALRKQGADYLILPSTAFCWRDPYLDFRRYVEGRYRRVLRQDHVCSIFDLGDPVQERRTLARNRKRRRGRAQRSHA